MIDQSLRHTAGGMNELSARLCGRSQRLWALSLVFSILLSFSENPLALRTFSLCPFLAICYEEPPANQNLFIKNCVLIFFLNVYLFLHV